METVYSKGPPRYRGIGYTKPIDAAKAAVPVLELAERLAGPDQLRRVGDRWVARCPLPEHDDKTPSFTVYPDDGGWFCYGCLHGGDVVELARLAWGYDEREAHVAAAMLLMEFGHEAPQRSSTWFRKQGRQQPVRDAIEDAKVEVLMRRLWHWIFEPILADLEDPDERVLRGNELWNLLLPRARRLVRDRRSAA
jgi:hypothetical protein